MYEPVHLKSLTIQKSETKNVETLAVAKLWSMGTAVFVPLQINGSPIWSRSIHSPRQSRLRGCKFSAVLSLKNGGRRAIVSNFVNSPRLRTPADNTTCSKESFGPDLRYHDLDLHCLSVSRLPTAILPEMSTLFFNLWMKCSYILPFVCFDICVCVCVCG